MAELPEDLDRLLHDLRGPLNAMQMHVEVLKRLDVRDPAVQGSVETIGHEVSRLAALLPAAFQIIALEPRDVAVHDLRALVEEALAEHGLTGVVVNGDAWPRVRADGALLRLAVAHLVRNAVAASEGARAPEITGHGTEDGGAVLVVRDWGRGLRTTNPRALIRLAAGANGRPAVGLVTVERIARLHHGRLEFRTPSGGGAEVRLILGGIAPDG
jgi:signal transduction histidine kinase